MISLLTTGLSEIFRPIPSIRQEIDFTRDGELKLSQDLFSHGHFGLKPSTTLRPFRVVEVGPKGKEKVFIQQSRKDPLMSEDVGQILGMIFMPATSGDLFAGLLGQGIIDQEKEDRIRFDLKGTEKMFQGGFDQLFLVPDIGDQKPGKTGQGSLPSRLDKGLNG